MMIKKMMILSIITFIILISISCLGTVEGADITIEDGIAINNINDNINDINNTNDTDNITVPNITTYMYTINNNYAKNKTEGFKRIINDYNLSSDDNIYMIGNSTSDIVPKKLEVPTIILKNGKEKLSDTIIKKSPIIVDNFCDVINEKVIKL